MNTLLVFTLACLAYVNASGHGVIVSGPSGVVTSNGPVGAGWGGHGGWGGYGGWNNGAWGGHGGLGGYGGYGGWGNGGHGGYGGWGHGGYSDAIVGHGVAVVGPSASGYGTWNGALGGHGHGVAVVGPATVPATIVGPSGKIVADGLYGVGHGHGYGGHW